MVLLHVLVCHPGFGVILVCWEALALGVVQGWSLGSAGPQCSTGL